MSEVLLEVRNIKKHFPIRSGLLQKVSGYVKAVDGVSFSMKRRETLGLVGESGCGKSTTGRVVLRLLSATSGEVLFRGRNLLAISGEELRRARREFQMIFQDPFASLDPRMTVAQIVGEPLAAHRLLSSGKERKERVAGILEDVGLDAAVLNRYAFEFSGGQRQRIGIARALVLNPSLVVADEPVSALDVSIQAQVINLLAELREKLDLTYLFIAHDLSVVKHISDRVAVMYLGRIVEMARTDELFANPLHPYTQALLSAAPVPMPGKKGKRLILGGDVPSPLNPPSGCPFHPRCFRAIQRCRSDAPESCEREGHFVVCHLYS